MTDCNNNHTTKKLSAPQRNNYFYGKLLDESSLKMEQAYFNQKRWMMNRLGLGSGVLCGLTVDVRGDCVCIAPGVAIDTMGHEIVVPGVVPIDPRKVTDDRGVPTGEEITNGEKGYVCLVYRECLAEPVPVLVTDCDSTNQQAPSVIKESFCLIVKKGPAPTLPSVPDKKLCEALREKDPDEKRKKICEVLSSRPCSTEDTCGCVVLAGIEMEGDKISVIPCDARPLVYSNPELFEMLMCLSESGGGGSQGPAGPPGLGIDLVEREVRLCTEPPTVRLEGTSPNRTLYLGIPPGCDGAPGPEGPGISQVIVNPLPCEKPPTATLVPDAKHRPHQILTLGIPGHCDQSLTKITEINWPHDGEVKWLEFLKYGLKVDFSDAVHVKPNHDEGWFLVSIELSSSARNAPTQSNLFEDLLSMLLTVVWPKGTTFVYRADIKRGSIPLAVGASGRYAHWVPSLEDMNGLQMLIQSAKLLLGIDGLGILVRVVAKCDFLIDKNGKCVDGNHLRGSVRPGAVTGDDSGDGVGGGEFESWFQLTQIPDVLPFKLMDALEKLSPGTKGLAAFFNKGV